MKKILVFAVLLLFAPHLGAHDHATPVIIDTDAAIDDLRAITLLLADEHIDVLAITVSEGACSVPVGSSKVKSLLMQLGRKDIPVGAGNRLEIETPPWRQFAEGVHWGDDSSNESNVESATNIVQQALSSNTDGFVYIALGSLNTLAHLLERGVIQKEQVDAVLWYNDGVEPLAGNNYSYDPAGARAVLNSGIPVNIVGGGSAPLITPDLLKNAGEYLNRFALAIVTAHTSDAVQKRISEKHLRGWDDQVALWLHSPELFTSRSLVGYDFVKSCRLQDEVGFYRSFLQVLENAGGRRKSVVLKAFPLEVEQYTDDLAPVVKSIIERHGEEEFRVVVMTNELHRHLGIYSIVGAKMGLRARELLDANKDALTVKTLCGSQPPISCMNDGIQVSTGATLGQGLITVIEGSRVAAEFTKGNNSVTLELKPGYIKQVKSDIRQSITDYGYLTPAYWKHVRALAIRYWHEWDREELFTEK